jgi:hypothetical protein
MPQKVHRACGQAEVRGREPTRSENRDAAKIRVRAPGFEMAFSSRQLNYVAASSLGRTRFTFLGSSALSTLDTAWNWNQQPYVPVGSNRRDRSSALETTNPHTSLFYRPDCRRSRL